MTEHLAIRTLGGLAIQLDGTPIEFETQKEAALLVYLAYTGRTHPREVVAEMLWEERTQSQALANLRHVLTQLRQRVDPYVTISRQSVAMNAESDWWLDVAEFERQLHAAGDQDVQALETALDLYQGDFLAGVYVDSQAFEDWARLERERLRFRAMDGLDARIRLALHQREYPRGIACATQLLQMDSLREETHQRLMLLLTRSGQRGAALEQYATCQRILTDELGVEPLPETTALYECIRAGELGEMPTPPSPDEEPEPDIFPAILSNPYKGLRAFEEADAEDFFGRDTLIERLLARLGETGDWTRFLAVVGPSGSGKSSVVRAGLIPALRGGALPGSKTWHIVSMLPGARPFDELGIVLHRAFPDAPANLIDELQRDPHGILRASRLCLPDDTHTLLLVIDQFEEAFTLVDDPVEARRLLDGLYVAATTPRSPVRILITLRADFYDRPLMIPDFSELVRQRTEVVTPMTPEELERAVVGPAERVGTTLESGLVAEIVAEVSQQPGALPMMEYALTELFDRRQNGTLTLEAYQAIGGALGALARRADEVYTRLTAERQEAARQLFLRLVTLGEGTEDTRRRARQTELLSAGGGAMHAVLHTFDRSRLLTFDQDPTTGQPLVELAHEAIIREWGQLRAWLDESRHDIRQQRLLAAAAAEWEQAGRHADYLLAGSRLAQFEDWAARTDLALTSDERLFLDASVVEQQARQVRRQRIRNLAFGVTVAAALIMAVLALAAFSQRGQAIDARATSDASARIARQSADEARELALINGAQAALASGDMDTALALAVAANQGENPPPEAQVILSEAAYRPGTIRVLKGHTEPNIESVAFSPDARFALSGANDDMLLLWDVDPTSATFGTVLDRYEHTADVWSVVFRPDGHTAVFGSSDTNVYLIEVDLTSHTFGAILHRFEGHTDGVEEVALSPDGHYALSGSYDSTLILWDVDPASPAFGTALHQFEGHTDEICDVAYSPDGRTGLSAALDDTVIQWDVDPASPTFGAVLQRFEVPVGLGLPAAVFSPDGRLALSGGDTAILWDLETHDIIHRFEAGSFSEDVAFSPDGHTALVAQGDGIITLWNVETGKLITRLSSHTAGVLSAVFSPDGRRILSCGLGDGVLRLWDVQYGTAMRTIVSPLRTDLFLSVVALSPNGRAVLWGGTTYKDEPEPAILTDIATGQEIYRFDGYSNGVSSATFAPDGRTALISGWAGEMILWDMDTGERLRTFTGHMASLVVGSNATYTAFSPDRRTALSVAKEEQAVLWDVAADSPTFGQPIRHFADPEGEILIFSPSFSLDGRTALTGTRSGSVLLWDVETGQVIYRLTGYTGWPGAGFSPDGRTALTWFSGQSNLILWDVGTGQEIRRLSQKMAPCAAAAFSPDGRTAFSDSVAGVVTQWDIATSQAIRHYLDTGCGVLLSPDGRSFFTTPDAVNLVQWRIDTLDELLAWTLTHRYVRELTCSERETYQIEPLCDAAGNYPASTPYLTATPPATPTVTPTADLKRTTATLPATVTPTVAPLTLSVAHIGENRGDVAIGDTQFWTYEGRAGEVLTIRVEADHPANWDTRREGEPTPEGGWFDTRLSVTSPEGAILMHGYSAISIQYNDIEPGENTNSQVEGLTLPVDGTYLILVSGNSLQTGGAYMLTIESEPPGTVTPTLGR